MCSVSGFTLSAYKSLKLKELKPSQVNILAKRKNKRKTENSQNPLTSSRLVLTAIWRESDSLYIHSFVQDLDIKDIGYSLCSSANPLSWQGSKASDQYSHPRALMSSGVAFLLQNALRLQFMFTVSWICGAFVIGTWVKLMDVSLYNTDVTKFARVIQTERRMCSKWIRI